MGTEDISLIPLTTSLALAMGVVKHPKLARFKDTWFPVKPDKKNLFQVSETGRI